MIRTVSLETAKKLKDEGFIQGTDLFWTEVDGSFQITPMRGIIHDDYAAPTTDELLEELPWEINMNELTIEKGRLGFLIKYGEISIYEQKELCECLAQMWLFLKKEGLLEV